MRRIKGLIILSLIIFLIACSNKIDQDKADDNDLEKFIGQWTGAFEMPGRALAINITFDQDESTFRYVMQDDASLPLKNMKLDHDEITFTVGPEEESLIFNGKISDEQIAGTVKFDQHKLPFTLYRFERDVAELIEIETRKTKLTGELLLPETDGPHPVLLIIPGTTDRNGNSNFGENNSLKYLAESLADKGIATVRYDKRGVGDNKQEMVEEESILFDQLVEDAEAWTRFLATDNRFTKVGLIGYEQGALEAMIVADEIDVELIISIAGVGRTYGDVLADDLLESLKDDGQEVIEALKAGEMVEEVPPELLGLFHPGKQAFLISMINLNPAEIVAKQSIPYLIIHGENDIQLDVTEAEILSKANRSAELLIVPEMNHILRTAPSETYENMLTYTNPTLPLADGLMEGIFDFLEVNDFN